MRAQIAKQIVLAVVGTLSVTALLALLTLFVLNGSFNNEAGKTVVIAILYLLPLIALQAGTEKPLSRWADSSPFPMDWVIYSGTKLILSLAGAGAGSLLTLMFGIERRWSDLYFANRLVVVVVVLAAIFTRLYNKTRTRLEQRNRELEATVEAEARSLRQHEQEAERAREIQQALMPRDLPRIAGCHLAAECLPSRAVGGDYFDAIRLGDSRVAIAIADVSGKGMGAALLMSNLQAIVRAFAPTDLAPQELCVRANQLIAGNVAPGKYITFFYAVVDTARMRVDYCNAGHNPPLLGRRSGAVESLSEGGPVLGILPDAPYVAGSAELKAHDCLALYTDGITEATDEHEEEFGEERLKALVASRPAGAEECRAQIVASVSQYAKGNFNDDVTVLVATID